MADDKKKPVLGLLAALKPAKPAPAEDSGESPRTLAARGVREAVNSGDDAALADALDTFFDSRDTPDAPPAPV